MRHGIDGIFAHESSNVKSNFVIQKISLFYIYVECHAGSTQYSVSEFHFPCMQQW